MAGRAGQSRHDVVRQTNTLSIFDLTLPCLPVTTASALFAYKQFSFYVKIVLPEQVVTALV